MFFGKFGKKKDKPKLIYFAKDVDRIGWDQAVMDLGHLITHRAAIALGCLGELEDEKRFYAEYWSQERRESEKRFDEEMLITCITDIYMTHEDMAAYNDRHPDRKTSIPEIARLFWEMADDEAKEKVLKQTGSLLNPLDARPGEPPRCIEIRNTFDDVMQFIELISYGENNNGAAKWCKEGWDRTVRAKEKFDAEGLKGRKRRKAEEEAYIDAMNTRIHLYDAMRRIFIKHKLDPACVKKLEEKRPYLMLHENEMEVHWTD